MAIDARRTLTQCLDQLADAFVGRLQPLGPALTKSLEARAISEPLADRRKMLTGLHAWLGEGWGAIVSGFDEAFRQQAAQRAGWQGGREQASDLSNTSLRLLDDEQVEWDLAFGGATSRLKVAAGGALAEFDQRIQNLHTGFDADIDNPIGLDVAGAALKQAIEQAIAEPGARRALLVHLDPLLAKEMPPLFAAANAFLAERGVDLPARAKAAQATARVPGRPAAGSVAAATEAGGDRNEAGDVFAVLQRLVQAVPGLPGGGGMPGATASAGATGASAGMVAVPAAMLESLNALQAIDLGKLQAGADGEPMPTNVLRDLRQQEAARQLPPIEAATIDIVAMLFDFIFDDKLVPDAVKALVGRLQIPLLKVAMLDRGFFASREHPARALLDAISRLSVAAGKGIGHGDPVFEKIRAAVNRVLAEFEKDQKVFAELLVDMQALLAEEEKRSQALAEQTKLVAERQEQSDLAEVQADEAFARVLAETITEALPSHIGDFLSRHWTNVLKFALLKGGVSGHPWALAVQTLNELLWSLTPKSGDDRQRLIALLPGLLRRVNAYLDRVGVSQEEKAPFMDALVEIHSAAIKGVRRHSSASSRKGRDVPPRAAAGESGKIADAGKTSAAAAAVDTTAVSEASAAPDGQVSSRDLAPTVVVTRVMQESGIEVESMALAGKVLSSRPVRLTEVGKLQRGDWVEFTEADGEVLRARLSWVSPYRGIMLFTNPQSSKAISISPEALAVQMKRGLAIRLDEADEPLVDRALGKAMRSAKPA